MMNDIKNLDIEMLLDLLEISWVSEGMEEQFDEIDNFGFNFNLSVIKRGPKDYAVGMHVKSETEDEVVFDRNHHAESSRLIDALLQVSSNISKDNEDKEESDPDQVIASLKTDNALLERRIEELTKNLQQAQAEKRRSRQYNNMIEEWLGL